MINITLVILFIVIFLIIIYAIVKKIEDKRFRKNGWFELLFDENRKVKLKTRGWIKTDELLNNVFLEIKSNVKSDYYNTSYINSYKEMFKVGLETYMKDDWYKIDESYKSITHIFEFIKKDCVSPGDVNEFLSELLDAIKEENRKINKMEREASNKEIEDFKVTSQRCIDIVKNMRSEIENMTKIGEKTT